MNFVFSYSNMKLSKKSISGVTVLLIAGIVIVGWSFLNHQLQGSFGIHLLNSNKLAISDEEIVSYNKTSHEIKLTVAGAERIKALKVPVTGSPFVIKINGKEIYNGSFWVSFSSLSCSGIVIDTLKIQDNTIKIEKGYPSPEFFIGKDPRNNSEVFNYFQKIGKLVH